MRKAVVLLSGGLDSATTLYHAKSEGYKCRCLIFDYGQRHRKEIESAKKIAKASGCGWQLIKIKLPWKGSALLNKRAKLPVRLTAQSPRPKAIPATYVPGRNIIFLSFAVSCAETIGAEAVFIGANAIDYSGYPDCRPEFLAAFQEVVARGTKVGSSSKGPEARVEVKAPIIRKTKKEIVKLAKKLKVPLELTWSCYKGGKRPCGVCDSCVLRARGFREAALEDALLKNA
jgi:7-cyano-7-deazaguanine synthase